MPADVMIGLSAFKAMLDGARALKDINDATVRQSAVIELQSSILAAQAEQSALVDTVRALKERITQFENWNTEKQRYELKDLGFGAFAFMLKSEERGAQPPHWICANCFSEKRVSIIQYGFAKKLTGMTWHCQSCQNQINPDRQSAKWED
ncbi:MAG: hypothetical protein HY059_03140 [Proteobacteria bacterium]|nr:hypothetical protein [Pseudomonadota bacterium]